MAFTNIAANNIEGVTLHNGFGVDISENCSYKVDFLNYDMIIIDEISMINCFFYTLLQNARL